MDITPPVELARYSYAECVIMLCRSKLYILTFFITMVCCSLNYYIQASSVFALSRVGLVILLLFICF